MQAKSTWVYALFDFEPIRAGDLKFRAGDILKILSNPSTTSSAGWAIAFNPRTSSHGDVPSNYLTNDRGYSAALAGFQDTSRSGAIELLNSPDYLSNFNYIVRPTSDGGDGLALSVQREDQFVMHYKIHLTPNDRSCFLFSNQIFGTFEELIVHYMKNEICPGCILKAKIPFKPSAPESPPGEENSPKNPDWAVALFDFNSAQMGDLAMRAGDLLQIEQIFSMESNNCWIVASNPRTRGQGRVPASYISFKPNSWAVLDSLKETDRSGACELLKTSDYLSKFNYIVRFSRDNAMALSVRNDWGIVLHYKIYFKLCDQSCYLFVNQTFKTLEHLIINYMEHELTNGCILWANEAFRRFASVDGSKPL